MLHGAAEDPPAAAAAAPETSGAAGAAAADATPAAPQASSPPPPPVSPEMQERIARFNERNSGRRRSPWQVVEDAPLLLQRLWSDLRRGDTQVFGELIRRGVQLQLFVVALYILSPVSFVWFWPLLLCYVLTLISDVPPSGSTLKRRTSGLPWDTYHLLLAPRVSLPHRCRRDSSEDRAVCFSYRGPPKPLAQ